MIFNMGKHFKYIMITILLLVVILEILMRLIGFILTAPQDIANQASQWDSQSFRILTLGESTTAGSEASWPGELEKKLRANCGEQNVRVFNGGVSSATTSYLLAHIQSQIKRFQPHLVIIMAGINDTYYTKYDFDADSKWRLFLDRIRVVKLYRWVKDNIKYSLKKYGKRNRFYIDEHLPPDQWREFNEFLKIFNSNIDSENVDLSLSAAREILWKYEGNLTMARFVLDEIIHGKYYDLKGKPKKKVSDFIINQSNIILSRVDNFVEAISYKAEIYTNLKHKLCISTVVQLLEFTSLSVKENSVVLDAIGSCGNQNNLSEIEVLQNYLSDQRIEINSEKKPFLSFQNNIGKLYNYLDDQEIDVIFMQYPIVSVKPLKYTLSVDQIDVREMPLRYRDALISHWEPPSYSVDEKINFLENRKNFQEALRKYEYKEIFIDRFADIFGHMTQRGHNLIANNVVKYLEEKGNWGGWSQICKKSDRI